MTTAVFYITIRVMRLASLKLPYQPTLILVKSSPLGLALALVLILPGSATQASRAIPMMSASGENLRLAIPHKLSDVIEQKKLGFEDEPQSVRDKTLAFITQYIQHRRTPSRHNRYHQRQATTFVKTCTSLYGPPEGWHANMEVKSAQKTDATKGTAAALCLFDFQRQNPSTPKTRQTAQAARKDRRNIASELIQRHWESVRELPYSSIVGITGYISSYDDLFNSAKSLARDFRCENGKIATALAYKLEEYFPDQSNIDLAKRLYKESASCDLDFSSAKAAYRLSLLNIWANSCETVPRLMTQVENHPEASQFRSRAKYWKAYCSEVLGKKTLSREARESLLAEYPMSFHNLAANGSHDDTVNLILKNEPPSIAYRSLIRPDLNPFIRAIEALLIKNEKDLAAELVDRNTSLIQELEPEVRLYLAALMNNNGQALSKFRILSSLFSDLPQTVSSATLKLFFPLWFFDIIEPQAGESLDPLLITALIRQESAFNIHARSRVGARGLMQLMPATARTLAHIPQIKLLFDPAFNVRLGTKYLKKRLNQYEGDVELTLAAYNAGFARVDEWKRRYPTENRLLFIDLIPFRETRDYVASILRNYYWYTKLYASEVLTAKTPVQQAGRLPAEALKPPAIDLSPTFKAIIRAQAGLAQGTKLIESDSVPSISSNGSTARVSTDDLTEIIQTESAPTEENQNDAY